MQKALYQNLILSNLRPESLERLRLEPIELELQRVLQIPDRHIERLVFVEQGVISTTVKFEDGSQIEVGLDGCESAVGLSALMSHTDSFHHVYVQLSGHGNECSIRSAQAEFERREDFYQAIHRCAFAQQLQAMQSAACNAKHNLEQRLARWLLSVRDKAQSDSYKLSHEFLAEMLGCSRPALSRVAGILTRAGLIRSVRGTVYVLDFGGLELHACECYRTTKTQLSVIHSGLPRHKLPAKQQSSFR